MRSAFILTLMAATAVTPVASAAAQDRGRDRPRAERSEGRAERPQRAERAQRPQREAPQQRAQRVQSAPAMRAERMPDRSAQRSFRGTAPTRSVQQAQRRDYRYERGDAGRGARIERRDDRRDVQIQRNADRRGSYNPRSYDRSSGYNRGGYDRGDRGGYNRGDGNRGQWSDNRGRSGSWNQGWRNDRRYDWQRYRNSNRNIYHLGRYYSPYRNHHYNRFSIGLFLGSGFYGSNYWISDPSYYRLPPAYPGTRWVRYYDDVMLVDTYTGEVLDVIYDFFW